MYLYMYDHITYIIVFISVRTIITKVFWYAYLNILRIYMLSILLLQILRITLCIIALKKVWRKYLIFKIYELLNLSGTLLNQII